MRQKKFIAVTFLLLLFLGLMLHGELDRIRHLCNQINPSASYEEEVRAYYQLYENIWKDLMYCSWQGPASNLPIIARCWRDPKKR